MIFYFPIPQNVKDFTLLYISRKIKLKNHFHIPFMQRFHQLFKFPVSASGHGIGVPWHIIKALRISPVIYRIPACPMNGFRFRIPSFFFPFINRKQLQCRNPQFLQVRKLFFYPTECSSSGDAGRRMACKSPDMHTIHDAVLIQKTRASVFFPVKFRKRQLPKKVFRSHLHAKPFMPPARFHMRIIYNLFVLIKLVKQRFLSFPKYFCKVQISHF